MPKTFEKSKPKKVVQKLNELRVKAANDHQILSDHQSEKSASNTQLLKKRKDLVKKQPILG